MARNNYNLTALIALTLATSGCASLINPGVEVEGQQVRLDKSYLEDNSQQQSTGPDPDVEEKKSNAGVTRLQSISDNQKRLTLELDLSKRFGNEKKFQASVNAMPLNDFLHYTFGELLNASYLIEPSVKANKRPVTLELKEKVSAQRLFRLVTQVLNQNNVTVSLNNDIFYIHPKNEKTKTDKAFGFGRSERDIPRVSGEIIQLVPVQYNMTSGMRNIVGNLVDAAVFFDASQKLLTITGQREQVKRALSLVRLLDSPAIYNKSTALIGFDYISSETFTEKITGILEEEGISVATSSSKASSSVRFISLEHLGQVVVFASNDEIIDRVEFWRDQLDKPASGAEQSFYIYHPRYARASDLGESLAPLIGGEFSSSSKKKKGVSNSTTASTNNANQSNSTGNNKSVQTIEGDNMRLVVDERANSLIFYSTGQYYQELQPIIRQLDIMPKQVMMEVVIAEVKLTGSFAKGVQYAIESGQAESSRNEIFSFNQDDGFNYSIVGLPGSLSVSLNQTDGLVNVLSRPTLLVRDGVSASISVGDDIPTVGSTTIDPLSGDRQTTEINYRKTGVDLKVTPTINAQGTVIMTIEQNISNVNADSSGAGNNPAIFERTLNTEVVAGNGQTVMLGGLISENRSNGSTSIPGFGDIPLLGHLFRSDTSSTDKTELVVLVTPKIVKNLDDWQRVKESFTKGLENIQF
ncbi:general secretion pathway protein D [Pseudoalteromonas sp. SW0106-04]|uniref:secretin N-terminal domain-containing protein n=1 Tax=Pseudoalteromonas sp. SW0106-04 TaxID=1702169 RepID=UPI0006C107FB|nr:secretin N-terminal domain-containing protein [Pseudoalteromonas sp. SW0106-04]GAP74599.1 general secretion pathway protein D [Pseudoalteromonas sp. SW0106-04]